MEIPNDDSDLLGKSVEDVTSDLEHRDTIIKHRLLDELTPPATRSPGSEEDEVNEFITRSTALTRLKWVFLPDDSVSDTSLSRVGRITLRMPILMGTGVGVFASVVRSVTAYDEFVRRHQLTAWRTAEMAKRRAADQTMLRALSFGLSVGIKTTVLATGCFVLPLTITAAQGRTGFWDYALGWGLSCSLFCINRGRRQMLVAAAAGAFPGLVYGCLTMVGARSLGLTFEDLYREQVKAIVRQKLHVGPPSLAEVIQ